MIIIRPLKFDQIITKRNFALTKVLILFNLLIQSPPAPSAISWNDVKKIRTATQIMDENDNIPVE